MGVRIRNLIEQCNNYEAEQKARLEKNGTATSTCFENDKQPDHPKTTNTESAFLARAIEQVEKNMHVIGYSVEQLKMCIRDSHNPTLVGYFLGRNSLSDHFYTGRSNCCALFVA